MSLQSNVQEFVKANGIKKGYIANKIGLSPSDFSLWLHYKLYVNPEIEKRIEQYILHNK